AREQPLSDEEVATYWPEASETVLGLEATGELPRRRPPPPPPGPAGAPPEGGHPQHRWTPVPDRDRGDRGAARHGRRLARVLAGPSGRRVPASRGAVRGAGAGSGRERRDRDPLGS